MNPWMIAEVVLDLVQMKFSRDAILAKIAERQEAGATPEQIVADLRAMRDEAIINAQKAIDAQI